MKILTNVKVISVAGKGGDWSIQTDHPELPTFDATKVVHHALIDDFFGGETAESYSMLLDEGEVDGITPSGSENEKTWREVFKL